MKVVVLFLSVVFSITNAYCAESESDLRNSIDECLFNALKQAAPEITVGELRQNCSEKAPTLVKQRVELEKQASKNPFAIIPHKPNFVLPASVTSINQDPYIGTPVGSELDDVEIKFQVSLKYLAMQI